MAYACCEHPPSSDSSLELDSANSWRLQLYKWSDECWDEGNKAGIRGGTPERCLKEAVLGWGA